MKAALVAIVVIIVGALALPGRAMPTATTKKCAPAKSPVLYSVVEPVFVAKCGGCHDSRKAKNAAAQRVFESSSYPFATERPATLLHDLRGMFVSRGGLSEAERCDGLAWIDGGGLDANGKQPVWRR